MRLWDTYYTATSLEDAVKLLGEYRDRARIIAGGTDLIVEIENGARAPEAVIDVTRGRVGCYPPGYRRARSEPTLQCGSHRDSHTSSGLLVAPGARPAPGTGLLVGGRAGPAEPRHDRGQPGHGLSGQ